MFVTMRVSNEVYTTGVGGSAICVKVVVSVEDHGIVEFQLFLTR